ncbi:DUF421 domain-containing protein [Blastomonas aquatica]|uniref:DUF421 domain-containing protein n=1 Tax=Blastomonas aquatica TaxID=1510276 RepID=A0ABQ1IS69_9SPHN|nr:YetF domain-containing protein [Blastomonas aquatica]GGB51169.1 DUF421 domain-containing protein [Blastomonas aquatica]
MFFDSWDGIIQVLILGTLAYCAIIAILRISGKRTLAKMSAFDLVVTVALGSILATILLSKDVALVEGVAAFVVLVVLQYGIATLSVRSKTIEKLAKAEARYLLRDGVIDRDALRKERVTREEVLCAVRSNGFGDLNDIAAVFLETDGTFSVVSQEKAGTRTAFPDPQA